MKNFAKLIKLTLMATLFVSLFSCSDDDTVEPVNNSIAAIASRAPQFTTLVSALDKAGLVQTLDQNGPFTVFAPTNQAFIDAGIDVNTTNVDVLRQVLLNHVVMGTNLSTGLTTGYVRTMADGPTSTAKKISMYINTSNGVVINGGPKVTTADILASNGVIHQVDKVIALPTIATFAVADSATFSTLAGLLTAQNLVPTLQGTAGSPFTVFAPTNTAFTTFESQNPGVLASLTSAQKTAVLTYHVVGGANVISTAIPTSPITTLETGTFSITGTTITDEANRQTGIIVVDVQASNGIIHAINNVLLPSL